MVWFLPSKAENEFSLALFDHPSYNSGGEAGCLDYTPPHPESAQFIVFKTLFKPGEF